MIVHVAETELTSKYREEQVIQLCETLFEVTLCHVMLVPNFFHFGQYLFYVRKFKVKFKIICYSLVLLINE